MTVSQMVVLTKWRLELSHNYFLNGFLTPLGGFTVHTFFYLTRSLNLKYYFCCLSQKLNFNFWEKFTKFTFVLPFYISFLEGNRSSHFISIVSCFLFLFLCPNFKGFQKWLTFYQNFEKKIRRK